MCYSIYLLCFCLIITLVTFWLCRSPKFCDFFNKFPDKFIIKTKFTDVIFIKPKTPITKWFLCLYLIQLCSLLVVVCICLLHWIKAINWSILETTESIEIYTVFFSIYFLPIEFFNAIMVEKFIFKKNNKK